MKNYRKAAWTLLLICALLLTLPGCGKKAEVTQETSGKTDAAVPAKEEPRTAQDVIEELVVSYGYSNEEEAETTKKLLEELKTMDEDSWKSWTEIMDIWSRVNDEKPNIDLLPENLPDTDELCLVSLGFQLNPDGSMKPELLERLRVLMACAEQYPNAILVCTGGGTAAENEAATEAGMMAQYLLENGIDEDRIIVEDKSLTTAQNAVYTLQLLESNAPQVKSLAIISSDYHIATGTLFFEAASILKTENGGERVQVISNAAYAAPSGSLSRSFQAGGLIELSGDIDTAYEIYFDTYDIHDLSQLKK